VGIPERPRPFYTEFAWAAELIIDRPVQKECTTIAAWLVDRGVIPGSTILDAGCGAGRYAVELGRRGYRVHGVDMSPELLEQARRSIGSESPHVSFALGDIRDLPAANYDAVLCRGVLNDLVDDESRRRAFTSFARSLRNGGVLMLDVREWEASAVRKARDRVFRKRVETDRGRLTFTSITDLDESNHQLLIRETHVLETERGERSTGYDFVMRCWTSPELQALLQQNGFGMAAFFGAYDPVIAPGATDRLVVIAQRLSHAG